MVEFLCDFGADVNATNRVIMAHYNLVKFNFKKYLGNANIVIACCKDGFTPLLMACMGGSIDVIQLLFDRGADIYFADSSVSKFSLRTCPMLAFLVLKYNRSFRFNMHSLVEVP